MDHSSRIVARFGVSGKRGEVQLADQDRRWFVGDDHVWAWYRGRGVGPYPCISALLALEVFVDESLKVGVPLRRMVEILLDGCENLAVPGLIVGTLECHLESSVELLQPWFSNVNVWQIEFARNKHELGGFQVQGSVEDTRPAGRRKWNPREFVTQILGTLLTSNRLEDANELSEIGKRLSAHASEMTSDAAVDDSAAQRFRAMANAWASAFNPTTYKLVELETGHVQLMQVPPTDLQEQFAEEARINEMALRAWQLQSRYGEETRADWSETLGDDVQFARQLQATPLDGAGPAEPASPVLAVAAGVLLSTLRGHEGTDDYISWALETLCAFRPDFPDDLDLVDPSIFPWGADRSAARGVSYALALPVRFLSSDKRAKLVERLSELSIAPSTDVRLTLARAAEEIWKSEAASNGSSTSSHEEVLRVLEESAQKSGILGLIGDEAPNARLEFIVASLVWFGDAARHSNQVGARAKELFDQVLNVLPRAMVWHGERTHEIRKELALAIAKSVLDAGKCVCISLFRSCRRNAVCVTSLLNGFCEAATLDVRRRAVLSEAWPHLLNLGLEVIEKGELSGKDYQHAYALSALLPSPRPPFNAQDLDPIVAQASSGWPRAKSLGEDALQRWLELAGGCPKCVDALICLVEVEDKEAQVDWLEDIERLVEKDYSSIARSSVCLPNWLDGILAVKALSMEHRKAVHRIVDGLAAEGDARALAIQSRVDSDSKPN